jgi:hypothetical protein
MIRKLTTIYFGVQLLIYTNFQVDKPESDNGMMIFGVKTKLVEAITNQTGVSMTLEGASTIMEGVSVTMVEDSMKAEVMETDI